MHTQIRQLLLDNVQPHKADLVTVARYALTAVTIKLMVSTSLTPTSVVTAVSVSSANTCAAVRSTLDPCPHLAISYATPRIPPSPVTRMTIALVHRTPARTGSRQGATLSAAGLLLATVTSQSTAMGRTRGVPTISSSRRQQHHVGLPLAAVIWPTTVRGVVPCASTTSGAEQSSASRQKASAQRWCSAMAVASYAPRQQHLHPAIPHLDELSRMLQRQPCGTNAGATGFAGADITVVGLSTIAL